MRMVMAAVSAVLAASPALALNCANARSAVDKAICADPAVEAADDAMSAAFGRLRASLTPARAKALLTNQRRWLAQRSDHCTGDTHLASCLRDADQARTATLAVQVAAGPGLPEKLTPVVLEVPMSKTSYAIGLFLYRFQDPRTAGERALNAAVEARIAAARWTRDADAVGEDYEYFETASIAYASDTLLSIPLDVFFWGGGPHPDKSTETINVDMANGKVLNFDDMADKRNEAKIIGMCKKQLIEEERLRRTASEPARSNADVEEIVRAGAEGIELTVEDLRSWTFSGNEASVAFPNGRFDAYAAGPFQCDLRYADLRKLVKPGFPLPR